MLKRIWQWFKGLFQRLFGGATQPSQRGGQNAHATSQDAPTPPPLADSDYEYLFRQLLKGVAHAWDQQRIVRWFEGLKGRTTYADWVAWLRRFGEGVLASPAGNQELAVRLVQLAEMTRTVPSLREVGAVAYDIGSQLLNREPSGGGVVWEYDGPDAAPTAPAPPLAPRYQEGEQTEQDAAPTETITIDELLVRLQQDANLAQVVAQQFGLDTTDPQVIIQEVINQLSTANQASLEQATTWFHQGIEQDQSGNFEESLASYDKALEIRPDLIELWFNRGNALFNLGRFEEALASYDQVIEINPNIHEVWYNRGNALLNLGRSEEASASFNKAEEIQPK
jgi:tetratricopeptide (TPR) repeat protein